MSLRNRLKRVDSKKSGDGTTETEERIKEETKATIRCLPFEADEESLTPGVDMVTGKPSARRVLFARAY